MIMYPLTLSLSHPGSESGTSAGERGFLIRVEELVVLSYYGRASNMRLNGVSVALLKRVNPPFVTTSLSLDSPA
jgi:hypothetical protein